MDDYLTKPLQTVELKRVLGRWLAASETTFREPAEETETQPKQGSISEEIPPGRQTPVGESPSMPLPPAPKRVEAEETTAYDRSEVLKRCLGDEELMANLLQVFVQQAGEDVAEMDRAAAEANAPGVMRAAHRLKGSAANLSLERVRHIAFDLETHVRAQGVSGAQSLMDRLRAEVAVLESAIGSRTAVVASATI
jgi:HPt (histidine-containing phosphotransfer) domain-containing protein